MTLIQLPVEHEADPWLDRLQRSAKRDWRPDEWDWDTWTFTGIPENPGTHLFRCPTCDAFVPRAGRPCWRCAAPPKNPARGRFRGERINEFNLRGFPETMRWEIVCALQQIEVIDLVSIRQIVRGALAMGATSFLDLKPTDVKGRHMFRDMHAYLTRLKLTDDEILALDRWDVGWLRLQGRSTNRATSGRWLSFETIDIPWVRVAVKRWIFDLARSVGVARNALYMAPILCEVLAQRGDPDPLDLTYSDFEAAWFAILRSGNGYNGQNRLVFALDNITRHSQRLGITSPTFVKGETTVGVTRTRGAAKEDGLGRGITEFEADQLEAAIPQLTFGRKMGGWERHELPVMFNTVFRLMRDTGRRPSEVMSLRIGCIQRIDGKPTLIYDNLKMKRMSRRLPIPEATAKVVEEWQVFREAHPAIAGNGYLFPPSTYSGKLPHLGTAWFASSLAKLSAIAGVKVIPYDFRHAYAQRHADAGVPIDVLAELMDHKDIDMTRGYYRVAHERKREAIEVVIPLTVGRGGKPVGTVAYEVGAVAVPFGNCSEPTNVKAGGHSCPIRFQCSGCAFYSTDPSYLPAMEDHVANLRVQLELYRVNGSAPFIVEGMEQEVVHYSEVMDTMRSKMAALSEEDRGHVEQASVVLRRARGARRINVVAAD
jgi:integrase